MRFREQIREWLQSKAVGQAFQPAIDYPELRSFNKADLASVGRLESRGTRDCPAGRENWLGHHSRNFSAFPGGNQ